MNNADLAQTAIVCMAFVTIIAMAWGVRETQKEDESIIKKLARIHDNKTRALNFLTKELGDKS